MLNSNYSLRDVFVVFLWFFLCPLNHYAFSSEVDVTQNISIITYQVKGNRDKSFYPKNQTRYLDEGIINFRDTSEDSNSHLAGNIVYSFTDDDLIDREGANLKQFSINYQSGSWSVVFGDSFVSLSRYSVNNGLKGIDMDFKSVGGARLIFFAGVDASNWNLLWQSNKDDGNTERFVWGARIEQEFSHNGLVVGINYGGASDDGSFFSNTDVYKDINVTSVDLKYHVFPSLLLAGEFASSFRKLHSGDGNDYEGKSDSAYRYSVSFSKDKYSFFSEYSRVGPHFETTGGFSEQDLESLKFSGQVSVATDINISPYIYFSRDNIGKLKDSTSKHINGGINVSYSSALGFSLSGGWDSRKEYSSDKSSSNRTDTWNIGVSKSFSNVNVLFNYIFACIRDNVDNSQERNRHTVSFNLNGIINVGRIVLSWNLGESLGLDKNFDAGKRDVFLSHSCGMRMVFPCGLVFNGNFSLTDNNFYINQNDLSITEYTFTVSKTIKELLGASVEYSHKDNVFYDAVNDYAETRVIAKVSLKF